MNRNLKTIHFHGIELILLPQKALFHQQERTLFIADLHLGKSGTFRAHGIPIPDSMAEKDLKTISDLLANFSVSHLIILGDFLHHATGRNSKLDDLISQWRISIARTKITLIIGNHDRKSGALEKDWQIISEEEPFPYFGLDLCHIPDLESCRPTIAGHIHPKIRINPRGKESLSLPCFWKTTSTLILPAFSSFASGKNIKPSNGDYCFPIAGELISELAF